MNDPLDPTELLAAAKPTSDHVIEPTRLDAMIAQAIATPAPQRFALLHSWKMRAGSAVAAAAVATTAIVISLSSAPAGLSVLALPASTKIVTSVVTSSVAALPKPVTAEQGTFAAVGSRPPINFVPGRKFSATSPSLAVYTLTSWANPSSDVQELASLFGVRSDVLSESCAPGAYGANTVSSNKESKTAVVDAATSSTPQGKCQSFSGAPYGPVTWSYWLRNAICSKPSHLASSAANACLVREGTPTHAASKQQLIGWSTKLLTSLRDHGVAPRGLSIAKPTVLNGSDIVTFPVTTRDGVPTDQSEQFWFTSHGVLLFASGLIGSISQKSPYPALSQVAGVQLLHARTVGPPAAINPGGPMIPATTTTIKKGTAVATKVVTLRTVSLSYELVWLTDGAAVLLPQYTYRANNGDSRKVLALSPSYYRVQSTK